MGIKVKGKLFHVFGIDMSDIYVSDTQESDFLKDLKSILDEGGQQEKTEGKLFVIRKKIITLSPVKKISFTLHKKLPARSLTNF